MADGDLPAVVAAEAALHPSPWTPGNFLDSIAAGHALWVAESVSEEHRALIGYAVTSQVLDEAHLLNISVLAAAQRAGRGRALLDHLFGEARAAGATRMFLEVRQSNAAAIALYARGGFVEIGRRKGYYPGRDGREDAIVMAKTL